MRIAKMIATGVVGGGAAPLEFSAVSSADTYTMYGNPTTNYGTSADILVRKLFATGILKFDLSSIPSGAQIVSATLGLKSSANANTFGVDITMNIHRILADNIGWTELGATHNTIDGSTKWAGDADGNGGLDGGCSISGTDFFATAMGSYVWKNGDALGTVYSVALNASQIEAMLSSNAGIVIQSTSPTYFHGVMSRSNADAAGRPTLKLTYIP